MGGNELEKIIDTLKLNYIHIIDLLFDKNREIKKNYLPLSLFLFNSLVDKHPMLFDCAEKLNIKFPILCNTNELSQVELSSCVFDFNMDKYLYFWPLFNREFIYLTKEMLQTPIGVIPVSDGIGESYSISKIIRIVRNKDFAHFEPIKPKWYDSLKRFVLHKETHEPEPIVITNVIYSLSFWMFSAILFIVYHDLISKREIIINHDIAFSDIRFLFNQDFTYNGIKHCVFNGYNKLHAVLNKKIEKCLNIAFDIMFSPSYFECSKYILEMVIETNQEKINVGLTKTGNLRLDIHINEVVCSINMIENNILPWVFYIIKMKVEIIDEKWVLKLLVNNDLLKSIVILQNDSMINIENIVIGSNLSMQSGEIFVCTKFMGFESDYDLEFLTLQNLLWNESVI